MYYKEGCATLQTKPQKQVLGILGGLGPAASCYLYQMLIDHTPATCDQDHIDIVISSRASTPDRTAFIMGKSKDDPFAVMEQDGFSLVHYGATELLDRPYLPGDFHGRQRTIFMTAWPRHCPCLC